MRYNSNFSSITESFHPFNWRNWHLYNLWEQATTTSLLQCSRNWTFFLGEEHFSFVGPCLWQKIEYLTKRSLKKGWGRKGKLFSLTLLLCVALPFLTRCLSLADSAVSGQCYQSSVWWQAQLTCRKGTWVLFFRWILSSLVYSWLCAFGIMILLEPACPEWSQSLVIVLAVQFSQEQQYKVQVNAKMGEWAVRLNENAKILSTLSQFASCETLWSLRTETKNMFLFRGSWQHQLPVLLLLLSSSLPSFLS